LKRFTPAKKNKNIYKDNNYYEVNYTGISKFLYFINHKLLDFGVNKKYNRHIVEIGGGAHTHLEYMDTKFIDSYTIIDSSIFQKKIYKLKKKYPNINFKFVNYKKKNPIKKKFTRMIASHSFEHFNNFESNFLKLLNLMNKESIISIALPCDPGLLWRFLQYFSYLNQKKNYNWKNFKEKDLDDARDHITPVQNIYKIINYYFKSIKRIFFPLFIPIIEINIFLIIQVELKKFIRKS
jgi:phosphatidylethanolamine/phosphatidyl-N-methylethanolamine N-methyltransferase